MDTYEVTLTPTAIRTLKVRAGSASEAADIAAERAGYHSGRWTIDYPGEMDEHCTVTNLRTGQIESVDNSATEHDDHDDG